MKKFLKIAVVLMAVFAMTNFIACSTGSDPVGTGSSSEAGGETGGTGSGGTGGSGSGETGGSGSGGGSSETPVAGEYKIVYNGETVDKDTYTLEEAKALAAKYGLAETTDYKIDEAKKEIVLTDTGMAKVNAAMGGDPGAGTDPSDPGAGSEPTPAVPVTYSWSFSDLDLSGVGFTATDATKSDIDASDGAVAKVTFTSETGLAYNSDPTGLVLNLTNGASGGSFNKISTTQSAKGEGATAGAIEPSKGDMVYCELQGPFVATMLYGANSDTDKKDRTAQIKIGDQITSGTENFVPAAGASLTATYTGTDTVKVYFGGNNIIRIYDIIIAK